MEKKRIKAVRSTKPNGIPHTTTATKSSAKLSVISTTEGKSVVSSLSMSLERRGSIQYKPRKIVPCPIPAGQNTIIHLDNYTHIMAQRVTTTKTIKRAEIISEGYNSIIPCSSSGTSSSVADSKSITPSKKRGRKSSECKKSNEDKIGDIKMDKPHSSTAFKPILRKAKPNRRKKVIKPRRGRKTKTKAKPGPESSVRNKDTGEQKTDALQISQSAAFKSGEKILRPCAYTLQSIKCLSELTCPYLHSDFPCKYYYLNIPCPQDLKCQFMHNGPLRPDLKDALRSHILDLLSTKPSAMETHFVEQMHYIEDLSHRLYSFRYNHGEHEDVMDDVDDDLVLIVDESSNDFSASNIDVTTTSFLSNTLHDTTELDVVFKNIKETNSAVDQIDKKLKFLKTSNMPPNDKINELQNIYDLLKAQEKRLKVYETLNNLSPTADNGQNNVANVVIPQIVNDIDISESPENALNSDDDKNFMTATEIECSQAADAERPAAVGNALLGNVEENILEEERSVSVMENESLEAINSNVPQQGGIEIISVEMLPKIDGGDKSGKASYMKELEINDLHMPSNCKEEPIINSERSSNNSNVSFKESYGETENINEVTTVINTTTNENNSFDEFMLEFDDSLETTDENVGQNDSIVVDENKSCTLHNETLELEITNNEKEIIENNIKEIVNANEEVEETSPPYEYLLETKYGNRNRICLRSHSLQDNEESTNKIERERLTTAATKPFRSRRLRLPKPSRKITNKDDIDESRPTTGQGEKVLVQEVEAVLPSTQNVILTKRFLKKAKQKLDQQSLLHDKESVDCSNCLNTNVEETMLALHCEDQIEKNNTLNFSQDVLVDASISTEENLEKATIKIPNSRPNISSETPTSSSTITDKFHLGNPHVMLTKLKSPLRLQTMQKDMQAHSTTSFINPIVSSSTSTADNKPKQKRRCFLVERDEDSTLKASKKIRIDNSKSTRKIKLDNRKRTISQQSISSKDSDFEIESNDEKLSKASSYSNNKQDEAFETASTHEQQHNHSHQYEDEEEVQENEFDLRQQIENASSKSDLQLQFHQHEQQHQKQPQFQQQNVLKNISTTTATGCITRNNKNLPHKQYQQHEKLTAEGKESAKDLLHHKGHADADGNELEEGEITNTCSSNDAAERDEDEREQSSAFERIYKPEELTSSSNKYSNEITMMEEKINVEYSSYSSLLNKLEKHPKKRQINFQNASVNITPISSPTYGNDTIASPSPIKKSMEFRMGGEIDGSLTYPPMPYILHEIDLAKIEVNKPQFIDKLKKTIQLDPRIFKTRIKKTSISFCKSVETTTSNALVPITPSNNFNMKHDILAFGQPSTATATTTTMISSYDPRIRTSALVTEVATTPSLPQQTALTPYNSLQTVAASSTSSASSASSLLSSFFNTGIPNAVPIALQYHSSAQPIVQPQQQQTPNMFLYGCLQRSSWYQSLMSTMKIQINQSISQLIRALNNFHRERAFNPEMVFDVFKIDCAGELLEIMRNLGIFVDTNGVINEQRHDQSFAERSSCREMPVNATYSLIQQFLTPHTQCPAASGDQLNNVNEPMLSCYVNPPQAVPKNSDSDSLTTYKSQQNDNNCNRNCNCSSNSDSNYNSSNIRNENNNNNYTNQNNNRRYGNSFKKQYDNNKGNNNYQQRSSERSSYNSNNNYKNNPRFMKPGAGSPTRTNTSPTHSPKESFDGDNGGRFNNFANKKRFNNYNNSNDNNNNNNNSNGNFKSSWSSSRSNEKRYSNKYQGNNSPSPDFVANSPLQSPRSTESKTVSPPPSKAAAKNLNDEECWDSD